MLGQRVTICVGEPIPLEETARELESRKAGSEERRKAFTDLIAFHLNKLKIEAEIRLGRHRELVAELRSLVHAHPLNEWFHGQLIRVLGYSGRRSEALQAYQRLRAVLREELGVDPSPSVQELQRRLLTAGVLEQRATRGLPIPA